MARRPSSRLKLEATKLESAILSKIHAEVARRPSASGAAEFDTHIKGVCDIHGKGDHIKGSGPNYYKTTSRGTRLSEVERVISDYSLLVDRLAVDVAAKIRGR